jgi:hypothetical protein
VPGHPHLALLALTALAVVGGTACGGGDDGVASDPERFCGEAIAQQETIVAPPLSTEEELDATLDFYRLMGQLAPVAIAEEWNVLVETLETASTIEPADPESAQRVATAAYASEASAYAVKVWLERNCGLQIPITTIAPHDQVPARTTTVASVPGGSTPNASVPPGTGASLPPGTDPLGTAPPGTDPLGTAPPAPDPSTTSPG